MKGRAREREKESETDVQTDEQTDRLKNRQAGRRTDRQESVTKGKSQKKNISLIKQRGSRMDTNEYGKWLKVGKATAFCREIMPEYT